MVSSLPMKIGLFLVGLVALFLGVDALWARNVGLPSALALLIGTQCVVGAGVMDAIDRLRRSKGD